MKAFRFCCIKTENTDYMMHIIIHLQSIFTVVNVEQALRESEKEMVSIGLVAAMTKNRICAV